MQIPDPAYMSELVTFLSRPDVRWHEVDSVIGDWLEPRLIERLRAMESPTNAWIHGAFMLESERIASPDAREFLIQRCHLYILLADTRLSARERLNQLSQAGIDARQFLTRLLECETELYAHAARDVLDASTGRELLRGTERPQEPNGELLRIASGAGTAANALLSAADKPTSSVLPRPVWWQRWRHKE